MSKKSVITTVVFIAATVLLSGCLEGGSSGFTEIPETKALFDVSSLDDSHVWAVGEGGCISFYDGNEWTVECRKELADVNLYGVDALDENLVWAVGDEGTILHFDGYDWSVQTAATHGRLRDVSACDEKQVWAVGDNGDVILFDGTRWSEQDPGIAWNIHGVSALDENHIWAVGSGGILYFDGSEWELQWETEIHDIFLELQAVFALSPSEVWACGTVGYHATILFFNGKEWFTQFEAQETILPFGTETTVGPIRSISASNNNEAHAVAHGISFSFDGRKWESERKDNEVFCGVSTTENTIWSVGYTVKNDYRWGPVRHVGIVDGDVAGAGG
jgi:hypothetical protein